MSPTPGPAQHRPQESHHIPKRIVQTLLGLCQVWCCGHFPVIPRFYSSVLLLHPRLLSRNYFACSLLLPLSFHRTPARIWGFLSPSKGLRQPCSVTAIPGHAVGNVLPAPHSPVGIDGLGVMLWVQFLGRVGSQAWLGIVWLCPIACVVHCCWVTLCAEGKEGKCWMQNVRGCVGLGDILFSL